MLTCSVLQLLSVNLMSPKHNSRNGCDERFRIISSRVYLFFESEISSEAIETTDSYIKYINCHFFIDNNSNRWLAHIMCISHLCFQVLVLVSDFLQYVHV